MRTTLAIVALLSMGAVASAAVSTLYTPPAGDATYSWNTKYGPSGYGVGDQTMDVNLYFGAPYGNDYRVSIFEIPISTLAGLTPTAATLKVNSLGFGTNYYYGSANIGWLDVGSLALTGDVVADDLGPASTSVPGGYTIYDTYTVAGTAGVVSFDVLSCVQADLAAGRGYCTFVMSGSRDTWGSIYTAESGLGPRIEVVVPEPATLAMLALGGLALMRGRRR